MGYKINWFPGHMKKTLDEMKKNIKLCDAIIYVLDARIPESSLNPKIDEIVSHKPILYVLNKADLADDHKTKMFVEKFENQNKKVVSLVSSAGNAKAKLTKALTELLVDKIEKAKQKEINKTFKVMVIGVPNTGKSSIINSMAVKAKTVTGNKAGVTKSTQWVKVDNNFVLLDTPGTLWPNFEDAQLALKLAYVGSIKDDVLDISELGFDLMKNLIANHKNLIIDRYGSIPDGAEFIEIYDEFCRRRGYILRGGEIDYLRAGRGFIDDFRAGRIGKITLDTM